MTTVRHLKEKVKLDFKGDTNTYNQYLVIEKGGYKSD